MNASSFFFTFATLFLTAYLLMVGASFFIPFVIALVIWYLVASMAEFIQKIPLGNWRLPYPLAQALSCVCCLLFIGMLLRVVFLNINALIASIPTYEENLEVFLQRGWNFLGGEGKFTFSEALSQLPVASYVTQLARALTEVAGNAGIILIYLIFLMIEEHSFDKKLSALISNKTHQEKVRSILSKIDQQTRSYLWIKTLLSLATATVSYFIFLLFALPFAPFWALLIFLLNFIPTIGSIIATIFPCLLALIQFSSWVPFFFISTSLISLQFFIGNFVEPKIMGRSFNLSGLVIILSLLVWGQIWGITGMFLCVPSMVIMKIVFSNFPTTRPFAVLLSQTGEI